MTGRARSARKLRLANVPRILLRYRTHPTSVTSVVLAPERHLWISTNNRSRPFFVSHDVYLPCFGKFLIKRRPFNC